MCPMIAQVGAWLGMGVAWGFLSFVSCCHVIGVLCGSLVVGVQAGCLWWPLCWVGFGPDGGGVHGSEILLGIFLSSEASGV